MTGYSNWVDLIGLLGGLTISGMMIPQVVKVYRTKSAKDLSWGFLLWYFTGLTLIMIFSVLKSLWALYIPMCLEYTMLFTQAGLKYRYDSRSSENTADNKSPVLANSGDIHSDQFYRKPVLT
mmetsp:Transcript_23961/g.32966  ORF Transcript_23961/g.32966 Transcript_23961/m.32966 type:complete len:122 (-) Transcript_23961:135-500(-)